MILQELAYVVQVEIRSRTGRLIKRGHVYELLAASFGYHSYAALCSEAVFTRRRRSDSTREQFRRMVTRRCCDLKYEPIAADIESTLSALLMAKYMDVIKLADLVRHLTATSLAADQTAMWQGDASLYADRSELTGKRSAPSLIDAALEPSRLEAAVAKGDELARNTMALLRRHELGEPPAILIQGLEAAAKRSNALAHYALALFYRPYGGTERARSEFDHLKRFGAVGSTWDKLGQQWQDEITQPSARIERYVAHLRAAARLGNTAARFAVAEQLGDTTYLDSGERQVDKQADAQDVLQVAGVMRRLGRHEEARRCLTEAAEAGDTDAMRYLFDVYDRDDPRRCWSWIYLAQLLGSDFEPSDRYILHRMQRLDEDGSSFRRESANDAVQEDAVLERPTDEDERSARKLADELFERIQSSRQFGATDAG